MSIGGGEGTSILPSILWMVHLYGNTAREGGGSRYIFLSAEAVFMTCLYGSPHVLFV